MLRGYHYGNLFGELRKIVESNVPYTVISDFRL